MERKQIDRIREIAIYLEGLKKGKGHLLPLGNAHLEDLWEAIKELYAKTPPIT